MSVIQRLSVDLVDGQGDSMDLCSKVYSLELKLAQRKPTLDHLIDQLDDNNTQLSAAAIAEAVCNEAALLAGAGSRSRSGTHTSDESSHAIGDTAFRESIMERLGCACADYAAANISWRPRSRV